MPSEAASRDILKYLKDIQDGEANEEYAKAITAVNLLIKRFPHEVLAYKSKLVLLIRMAQWDEALAMIKKVPEHKLGDCRFEKSYILYRAGKLDEALVTLSALPDDDLRVKELKAQIFYKQDKYQESHDLLQWLVKNHTDESDEERLVNFQAVQQMLEVEKKQAEGSSSELDTSEIESKVLSRKAQKYKKKKEARDAAAARGEVLRKRRNRKRKILPKKYDSTVPPDPERWLPKHERTAFKKKYKKSRDRDIGRGTQGSASANPNVEFISASPNSPRGAVASKPEAAEGPRKMRPKQAPKRKKKPGHF